MNIKNLLPLLTLLFTTALLVLFLYVAFWPFRIAKFRTLSVADGQSFVAGESIPLQIEYCKYYNYESHLSVTLVGFANPSVAVPHLETSLSFPLGCHDEVLTIVPAYVTPSGRYIARLEVEYRINPLRVEEHTLDSTPFEIVHPNIFE